MTTLETNAGPAWAAPLQTGGAASADRAQSPRVPQQAASLLPLLSFGLVVAVSLLSLYVQVLNEQMQRAELFHQAFLASAASQTVAAAARVSTPTHPPVLQTASR
jgi:hypothetical protein